MPTARLIAELTLPNTRGVDLAARHPYRADETTRGLSTLKAELTGLATRGGELAVRIEDDVAEATGTLTCVHSNIAADDTVQVGGVTLTWKASPANENELDIKTTDATDATELARGINDHSVLSEYVTATAAADVVTVTGKGLGGLGEQIALASSDETAVTTSASALASADTATVRVPRVALNFGGI